MDGPEKKSPPPIPVVALAGPTVAANVIYFAYNVANGSFMLQVADERRIDGLEVPRGADPAAGAAIFEVGRFVLTPRCMRQALDTITAALKAYESDIGVALPTIDQFAAHAAMATLPKLGDSKPPTS